ncbi:MAG: ribosome-associated translation inhibitor RaiA [Patescibacteria group bacterium]|nr:ribosome-associated translation inhibitor RaiA [Patescibacteria group bacterium]MCL5262000.1 ribosome-associated translation inhibitor RaiA [Patescibacteria group bacterium]
MNINLKASGFELTPAIRDTATAKLGAVERLLAKFDDNGEIELDFEVSKTTRHHQKGDVFRAEANLDLPKKLIRAEATEEDLTAAIDKVKEILSEAVKKYKELNS